MNQKTKIIVPFVLVSSAAFILFQLKDIMINKANLSQDDSNSSDQTQNQTDQTVSEINFEKLSVLTNRCRGCGKCTRLDPQHFEIVNQKAVVISSSDLDSSNLQLAINNCHDQAIVLE